MTNLLLNGDFKAEWDGSHTCLRIDGDGVLSYVDRGNIFSPPSWVPWFKNDANFAQPEGRDVWEIDHPERVKEGRKAYLLFTFNRRHDCGLYQKVEDLEPETFYEFSAWPHAWSNHKDDSRPLDFPHPDDPLWSEGARYERIAWRNDLLLLTGEAQPDARKNFFFYIGVDVLGGVDPYSENVLWSPAWAVYNGYVKQLSVLFEPLNPEVTVFLRSTTLWPFKHNDAYWDDAKLVKVDESVTECRGLPRIQYPRTYHVVMPDLSPDEAGTAFVKIWSENPATVGPSYDDGGLGDLDDKTAVLHGIAEELKQAYLAFYDQYYPGTRVVFDDEEVTSTPAPTTLPTFHMQRPFTDWLEMIKQQADRELPFGWTFIVHEGMENIHQVREVSPTTKGVYRLVISQAEQGRLLNAADPKAAAFSYWSRFGESAIRNKIDAVCSVNETIATHDIKGILKTVRFDSAFAEVVAEESHGEIAPVTLLAPPGNPDHGQETRLLLPAVEATIKANGYLGPHTYLPCHPQAGISERWLADEGYHYHLRPLLSWDPEFTTENLYPRYLFLETGAVAAYLRDDGRPGGFITSGSGWRDSSCLNGDTVRYLALLDVYTDQIATWNASHDHRCECYAIFTQGFVGWEHFQFNEEFWQLLD